MEKKERRRGWEAGQGSLTSGESLLVPGCSQCWITVWATSCWRWALPCPCNPRGKREEALGWGLRLRTPFRKRSHLLPQGEDLGHGPVLGPWCCPLVCEVCKCVPCWIQSLWMPGGCSSPSSTLSRICFQPTLCPHCISFQLSLAVQFFQADLAFFPAFNACF